MNVSTTTAIAIQLPINPPIGTIFTYTTSSTLNATVLSNFDAPSPLYYNSWSTISIPIWLPDPEPKFKKNDILMYQPTILESYSSLHTPKYHKFWLAINEED